MKHKVAESNLQQNCDEWLKYAESTDFIILRPCVMCLNIFKVYLLELIFIIHHYTIIHKYTYLFLSWNLGSFEVGRLLPIIRSFLVHSEVNTTVCDFVIETGAVFKFVLRMLIVRVFSRFFIFFIRTVVENE